MKLHKSCEIVLLLAEGNAQRVLNFANEYLSNDEQAKEFYLYHKYLVFDCDDPPEIQQVITDMIKSTNNYKLLPSNLLFEIWLLMHFEDFDLPVKKAETYRRLASALGIKHYGSHIWHE